MYISDIMRFKLCLERIKISILTEEFAEFSSFHSGTIH